MRTPRTVSVMLVVPCLLIASCAQPAPAPPKRNNVTTPPPSKTTTPTTPAAPATQPEVNTPPAVKNPETPKEAETRWWLLTPEPVEGQLRVIASGSAAKLMDAREQAVTNARSLLARSLGKEPEESTIERTAAEESGGVYTAWVLISTPTKP